MYNLLPCIQFEFFKYFNFLTDYRVHILVVSFYAMANIHQKDWLAVGFLPLWNLFSFFLETLFSSDKCMQATMQRTNADGKSNKSR